MILDNLRELQEACDREWILSTEQVAKLLELQSNNIKDGMTRHGVKFVRAENQGQQSGWEIQKY
ncbi:MAG: hypothetical protein QNJ68_07970 [Microcoleaceae cyanobacterium MO_207.B10]|nr:hypothetical protein [Microcoleaceae cyanobacterium MO_207.B10]